MHEASLWARNQTAGDITAKAVLVQLGEHAGQDWSCYPGVTYLARIVECSDSTIRAALGRLVERGLIRVFERHRVNGTRRSNRYQLLPDGEATPWPDAEDWSDVRQSGGTPQNPEGPPPEDEPPTPRNPAGIPNTDTSVGTSPSSGRHAKRATTIAEDYRPTDEMKAWFAEQGYAAYINGQLEHAKFVDYWRGTGRPMKDWEATWRNWMRRAYERTTQTGWRPGTALVPASGARTRSTTDERVAQGMALAKKYEEMGL